MSLHLHLDVVGGISGDMFVAAMLAAFPSGEDPLRADLAAAGISRHVTLQTGTISKSGFAALQVVMAPHPGAPPTHHWRDIRAFLEASALRDGVKSGALAIFGHLAEAEATCHGVAVDDVHFHELADWDSLADIVAAASVIETSGAAGWSVGALPLGRGRVQTQHGLIPVPAPATTTLLRGFAFTDDGGAGERITPTGAAILRHLAPLPHGPAPGARLLHSGTGAGQRDIAGIPNILRLLAFESAAISHDTVTEINFEIDDMTPEEISVALDRIRAHGAVLDAGYGLGFGKKGRVRYTVEVLAKPEATEAVAALCFDETSTIGLRIGTVARRLLARQSGAREGRRVKSANRPGGATTKVESDDLMAVKTLKARRRLGHDHG